MEQGEDAVEILKVVTEKGQGFLLRRQGLENTTSKYITEDFRFPVDPLIVINISGRYHVLEGGIAGLFVNPLDSLRREYGKP